MGGIVKKFFLFALLLPALALALYDMKWFDLNHWSASFFNDGRWGYDPTIGSGVPGASWPQPLKNFYVFGAGQWLGAILPSPSPETLCTFMYNPNTSGTEAYPTLCRHWREGTDSLDRVYKFPGDWPPPLSRFPMAPQNPLSDMDLWCSFCDSNPANHIPPGRPLGIDAYLTVYGFSDSVAQDFFFLKYELTNCLGDSIRYAYFGMALDVDIGDGSDDKAGLILDHLFQVGQETIRVRNTAFAYDYDNIENPGSTWESGTPGAIAVMLLSAPDSLGLTAFKQLTVDIDPVTDPEQYLTLAGYNYHTGLYEPYDSLPNPAPVNLRMLPSSGPFGLAPDSTVTFWYAIIGSPFGDSGQAPSERDTSELALRCKWARYYFGLLTGISEGSPSAKVRPPDFGPTIVRNVLFLPRDMTEIRPGIWDRVPRPSLLDISGRTVMDLRSGTNDVSRLSPGVYFVREAQAQAQAQAVRKVIITR